MGRAPELRASRRAGARGRDMPGGEAGAVQPPTTLPGHYRGIEAEEA
jgi:hypothetical protein